MACVSEKLTTLDDDFSADVRYIMYPGTTIYGHTSSGLFCDCRMQEACIRQPTAQGLGLAESLPVMSAACAAFRNQILQSGSALDKDPTSAALTVVNLLQEQLQTLVSAQLCALHIQVRSPHHLADRVSKSFWH